jgi:predicted PurR-regulated permease PerM
MDQPAIPVVSCVAAPDASTTGRSGSLTRSTVTDTRHNDDSAGKEALVRSQAAEPSFAARRTLASTSVVAAVVVLLLFIWYARDVLLLAFAGILVGVFLRRLATWVSDRTPLSPTWALVVVVLVLVGGFVGTFAVRGESIGAEVRTLRDQLPAAADSFRNRLERYEWGRRAVESAPDAGELLPDNPDAIGRVTGVVSRTFSALASVVIIFFLGIVLAATPRVYVNGLLALLPASKVPRGREVLGRLYDTLWWWLIGRIGAMTFIGVVTGLGLWIIGVPLAFLLGLLAALLSFIPNIGPILSAIPAVLLALAQGPRQALWVVALYIGVQLVESYLLDPIIDRKTVYLPPALTILAQLVFVLFAGIPGLALATPLTAALVVLVTMLYVQDVLGRRDIEVASH